MSYFGPLLTGAGIAIDNIGYNVSDLRNGIHYWYLDGTSGITYDVYIFETNGKRQSQADICRIVFSQPVANATLLACGGGGGGGSVIGGGGGGGEVATQGPVTLSGTYTISLGRGGYNGTYTGSYLGGFSGENTSVSGTNVNILVKGGGGGGGHNSSAYSSAWDMSSYGLSAGVTDAAYGGGPGGGYGAASGAPIANGTGFYAGGGNSGNGNYGSGGGGSGGAGVIGSASTAGAGGAGITSSITGTSLSYGGGGGGGIRNGYTVVGNTGNGGGGNGGYGSTPVTTLGQDGVRGGGGGGGGWAGLGTWIQNGGKGSDGIVIISVPRTVSDSTTTKFSVNSGVSGYTSLIVSPTYNIGTRQNPATTASQIRAALGANNGDYWYNFSGKLIKLYTNFELADPGKGYVLVAKGRENPDWWNTAGQNMSYLTYGELQKNPVSILSNSMVQQLAGGSTWSSMKFLINRFSSSVQSYNNNSGNKATAYGATGSAIGALYPVNFNLNLYGGSWDDDYVAVTIPTFYLGGTAYTTAYVSANTYITFGSGTRQYSDLTVAGLALPKIMLGSADNSVQQLFTIVEPTYTTIRYEGSSGTSGTPGSPTIVYEATFFDMSKTSNVPVVEIIVGPHNTTTGLFNISNATTAYASGTIAPNKSYLFVGNATGTAWTLYTDQYVGKTNDSIIMTGLGSTAFSWAHFTTGGGSASPISVNLTHYGGLWGQDTTYYTASNTAFWTDTYYINGSLNDYRRNFTWTWSSHSGWQGMSAGSTIINGYQPSNEAHALQLVNVYLQS